MVRTVFKLNARIVDSEKVWMRVKVFARTRAHLFCVVRTTEHDTSRVALVKRLEAKQNCSSVSHIL